MSAVPESQIPWPGLLGTSLPGEQDYRPRVEGRLPDNVRGSLYRNGPGLFERGGIRKRHLLDGDGLIQALHLDGADIRYLAKFVRTEKFTAEEEAGRYLYPTWSTLAPGTFKKNLGGRFKPQAGVTVVARKDALLAFDDVGYPYELDAVDLKTRGKAPTSPVGLRSFNAHSRFDGRSGEWWQFGLAFGRHTQLNVCAHDQSGKPLRRFSIDTKRSTYLHDFFITERFVVFNLHAVKFNPARMLAGLKSFIECLKWEPRLGNEILVADRQSGDVVARVEAPPSFMWHGLNAFDAGNELVVDFVGYDQPDHFIGNNPEFVSIMSGRIGDAQFAGKVRRLVVNLRDKRATEEILADQYHEFPMVPPSEVGYRHRFGYFTQGNVAGTNLQDALVRIDCENGDMSSYCFGDGYQVGEPVLINDGEWLITQVLDGRERRSFFAVLRGDALPDGPVCKILLDHHVPISFHGCWQGRRPD
ncbi:MAG: carotenoid oxygenase family protein [Pseudomonadota bacterium]